MEKNIEFINGRGIKKAEGKYVVSESNSKAEFCIKEPVDGEVYVEISGIENNDVNNANLALNYNGKKYEALIAGRSMQRGTGQKRLVFNLGYIKCSENESVVFCLDTGIASNLIFSDVVCFERSVLELNDDIDKMQKEGIKDYSFLPNKISGKLELTSDKYLVISIPYRKQWKCFIDGEEVDTFPANIMYIGAKVKAGKHEIVLKYVPFEFYFGIIVMIIFFIVFVSFEYHKVRYRMRNDR